MTLKLIILVINRKAVTREHQGAIGKTCRRWQACLVLLGKSSGCRSTVKKAEVVYVLIPTHYLEPCPHA